MAKMHKLTKGGQTIYPATITDAVVNPKTRKSLTAELSELESKTIGFYKESTSGSKQIEFISDMLKENSIVKLTLIDCESETVNIGNFLFYGNENEEYDNISGFTSVGQSIITKLSKNYNFIRFYNNIDNSSFKVQIEINSLKLEVEQNKDEIGYRANSSEEFEFNGRTKNIISPLLRKGNTVNLSLLECESDRISIACFLFYTDTEYDQIQGFTEIGKTNTYKLDKDYKFLRVYNNNGAANTKVSLSLCSLKYEIEEIRKSINTYIDSSLQFTAGQEYSTSGRQIEIKSELLKSGSTICLKLVSANIDISKLSIFVFYSDTEYASFGSYNYIGQNKVFTLYGDAKFIRLYNNGDVGDYSVNFLVNSQVSEINQYFESSNENKKNINWENADKYWNNNGELVSASGYDYSSPINVANFKYYGLYGKLNKGNYSIVAVNENGEFDRYVIQTGLLDYTNTGYSLYAFRVPDDVNYISVSIYNNDKFFTGLFELKSPFLIDLIDKSNESNEYLFGRKAITRSRQGTESRNLTIPYSIKKDKWYEVKLTDCSSSSYILDVYTTAYPTPAYGKISKNSPILRFKALADETAVRCWVNINGDESSITVTVSVRELGYDDIKNLYSDNSATEYKVLILGNSYSQGGAWVKGMQEKLNITNLVNLGVSSATVKDKYSDRNTYPYTDRPTSSDNSGNHNTLACQIQKLKRLMAGTDLDEGESQIYTSESEYPNVIIIEGGMNDGYDIDEKEQTYFAQFEKKVSGVYIQQSSSKEVTQGSCYIKTPIEEVDRTCFAGAYRYLTEELLNLFPSAQIFFTTASGLGYWNGSVVEKRYKTAEQQRKCANLCAANIIDWSAEGQISVILTHPQGSGTEDDPYIWGQCTLPNADSTDLMHPNTRGGKKYGHLAALVIQQRFLDIENM